METKSSNTKNTFQAFTAQQIADYINDAEAWPLEIEDIIEESGFISDCDAEFGICHNKKEKVIFNELGMAVVRDL